MSPSPIDAEARVRAVLTTLANDTLVEDRWATLLAELEGRRTEIVEDRTRRPVVIVALAAALIATVLIGGLALSRSHRASPPAVRPASSGHFTIVRPGVETRSVHEPPASSSTDGAGLFVSDDGSKVLNVSTQRSAMVGSPSNAEQRVGDVDHIVVKLSETDGRAFASWDDRGDVYGFATLQPGSIDELTGIMPSLVHLSPDAPVTSIAGFHADPLIPGPRSTYVTTSAAGLVMWPVPLGRSAASDLDHIVSVLGAGGSGSQHEPVVEHITVNGRPGITGERADQNGVLFSPADGWIVGVFPESGPGDIAELTSLAGDVREVDDATWQHYVGEGLKQQVGDPPIVAPVPSVTGVTDGSTWTALVGSRGGRCVTIRAQGHPNAQCFVLDPPAPHLVYLTSGILAVITPPGTEPVVELSDDNVTTTVPTAALGPAYDVVPNEGWQLHVFAVSPGSRHASVKAMAGGSAVSISENVFAPTS